MPPHRTKRFHLARAQGFTLVELMIVIAIIGITAAVAAPNFRSNIASGHQVSAANNLLGALQFARSEAVTRRAEVIVCASADGSSCSGTDWSTGGLVLDGTTMLRSIPPASDVVITGDPITFKNDGTTTASSVTVDGTPVKTVSVNIIGYAKIY